MADKVLFLQTLVAAREIVAKPDLSAQDAAEVKEKLDIMEEEFGKVV